ncbi:MAG: penicillin-binding protein 2 [Sedimentisphaerales bacterium]|nr:penicillin-binding protein 2 [Sedimentisphaerales bacterium]
MKHSRSWWLGLIFLFLVLAGMGGVVARCVQLQVYQCGDFRARAARQQLKIIPQTARRGNIIDREGRILAMSLATYDLAVDPQMVANLDDTASELAAILKKSPAEIKDAVIARQDARYCRLARNFSEAQAEAIQTLNLDGVILESAYIRQYPMGTLAAHVLGFCAVDGTGLEGVEAGYNEPLSPQSGKWFLTSDAQRRPIGVAGKCQDARNGNNLVLTIDTAIQHVVEEQLEAVVDKFQAKAALGIVMEPTSGEVLALAIYPTFNPAEARQTNPALRRNLALTDPFEPGSTFKPFTVAAAMAGGYVKLSDIIDCENGYYSGKGFGRIREYENHSYGRISVTDIIVHSSNIGTAKLAQKMGKPYFYQMLQKFGFCEPTGIDLAGECQGIVRPLEEWNDKEYTLSRAAFGQAIAVTPIQLMRGFCCLANGGRLIHPRMVRGVISPEGMVVKDFGLQREDAVQAIPENIARMLVQEALTAVVERPQGTAHQVYLEGWGVFGKTGTAQVPKTDGRGYAEGKYVASFIAGAPAWDPKVCMLVCVREPDRSLKMGYTGGRVAAPAVKEILRQTLAYLGIEKREDDKGRKLAGF